MLTCTKSFYIHFNNRILQANLLEYLYHLFNLSTHKFHLCQIHKHKILVYIYIIFLKIDFESLSFIQFCYSNLMVTMNDFNQHYHNMMRQSQKIFS